MYPFHPIVLIICTCIPSIIGFAWYSPKAFGQVSDQDSELKHGKKVYLFLLLFSFLYTIALHFQVIHQFHLPSILKDDVGFANGEGTAFHDYKYFIDTYGSRFRTFGHGAFHGFLSSLFVILPIMGSHFMFENKSWKYILTHCGYWATCSIIMGGIICEFTK